MEIAVFTSGELGRSLKSFPSLLCCGTWATCLPRRQACTRRGGEERQKRQAGH